MASRPIVPQQPRDGAGAVVKHKGAAAEGNNNRRALEDIGNVVINTRYAADGKPQPQISRPVTRSFLANNAQAAAPNKKSLTDDLVDGRKIRAAKAIKQRVTTKPKIETVIEISSDSEHSTFNSVNRTRDGSSRKKVQTLTSVLTARSKAACGLTCNEKEPAIDIDAADADNQLAVVDYVEDIYKFYRLAENSVKIHDYMDNQPEINERMRAILVDWLIEVHCKFELMPETLYLTLHIVDRYLSIKTVLRKNLQLVGITAMLLACKYEEIWAPEINDFVCISDRAYNREQILAMEKDMLNNLEWTLTVPTPYVFLVRFLKAAVSDKEMEYLVFFFAELSLMQYPMIMYCPSIIAASAVYAARCTLKKTTLWTETLKRHTGFVEHQLKDCASLLVSFHSAAADSKLKVVYKKYSSPQLSAVAMLPPATNMFAVGSTMAAT